MPSPATATKSIAKRAIAKKFAAKKNVAKKIPAKRGPNTRSKILDRAERLFAAHGFHGISLNAVALASGVGNAGLIHHFPNKAALYREVFESLALDIEQRLDAALAASNSPKQRLLQFIDAQAQWAIERPQAIQLVMRELLDNPARLGRARRLPLQSLVEKVVHEVVAAQKARLLPRGEPMAFVSLLLGTLTYAAVARPTFARMRPRDAVLAQQKTWAASIAAVLGASVLESH